MNNEKLSKPVELMMSELRNKIINDCVESSMSLFFVNSVMEEVYREVNAQYTNDVNNRIQEYNKYLETKNNETEKEMEKEV